MNKINTLYLLCLTLQLIILKLVKTGLPIAFPCLVASPTAIIFILAIWRFHIAKRTKIVRQSLLNKK